MILQTEIRSPGIQIPTSLPKHIDIEGPLWVFVIEVNHFLAIEPMLDNRSLAHNTARIPLPNGLRPVF